MDHSISDALLNLFIATGCAGIVIAMAIQSCCIPLPSELIMPLAGFPAVQGRFNLGGTALAGAGGCVAGSAVGGRPLLLRYGRYVLISHRDADRADAFFARYGDAPIFATRPMPIVRTRISLPAGITRMHFAKFVIYTCLGSLPWCFALALAGYKLGQHWQQVGSVLHKYDLVIAVALVALVALFLYRHVQRPGRTGRGDTERDDVARTGSR